MRRLLSLPVRVAADTAYVAAFWLEAFGFALSGDAGQPIDETIRHRAGSEAAA